MRHRILRRVRVAALTVACASALAGCNYEGAGLEPKHLQSISPALLQQIDQKGMTRQSPILLRIFKEESELELWKQTAEGRYEHLKTYPICRWSGELGPKIREGDRQAPEGFYSITPGLMNPRSNYYLAFNLGYPNAYDRALGRTGAHLMVHGDCSSRGCYAMTDEQIGEIFALARESFDGGQQSFQVQAYPFRMTPTNLAKHRNSPHLAFWKMLKDGNDHFEVTRQEPRVDVCNKRYIFNAIPFDPAQPFEATRACPPIDRPFEIAQAVEAKQQADDQQYASLVSRGVPTAPVVTGNDGGTHPSMAWTYERKRMGLDSGTRVATVTYRAEETSNSNNGGSFVSTPTPAAAAPSTQSASLGGFSFARLFGRQQPAAPTETTASAPGPVPPSRPQKQAAMPSRPPSSYAAERIVQERTTPPTERREQQKASAPKTGAMPGAQPILATDGFSFR